MWSQLGPSHAEPVWVAGFPSSSAEGGAVGGGGFKHPFRPAWGHQSV